MNQRFIVIATAALATTLRMTEANPGLAAKWPQQAGSFVFDDGLIVTTTDGAGEHVEEVRRVGEVVARGVVAADAADDGFGSHFRDPNGVVDDGARARRGVIIARSGHRISLFVRCVERDGAVLRLPAVRGEAARVARCQMRHDVEVVHLVAHGCKVESRRASDVRHDAARHQGIGPGCCADAV